LTTEKRLSVTVPEEETEDIPPTERPPEVGTNSGGGLAGGGSNMPAASARREARSGSEDMMSEGESESETESKKRKSLERNVRTKELGCTVRPQKFFLQKSENKGRANFVGRREKLGHQ
jgi:hypothetical protein